MERVRQGAGSRGQGAGDNVNGLCAAACLLLGALLFVCVARAGAAIGGADELPVLHPGDIPQYEARPASGSQLFTVGGMPVMPGAPVPDGVIREIRPGGEYIIDWTYRNGKKDGPGRMMHKKGWLRSVEIWVNGMREGIAREYYESGVLLSEQEYRSDRREGLFKLYYENGSLRTEQHVTHDRRSGPFRMYYDNGALQVQGNYRDDRLDGIQLTFDKNGHCISVEMYAGGALAGVPELDIDLSSAAYTLNVASFTGIARVFYSDGTQRLCRMFSNGILDGITREYYPDGFLMNTYTCRSGLLEGPATGYYESGAVRETVAYAAGKRSGWWRQYYDTPDPHVMEEGRLSDDIRQGIFRKYYPEGGLAVQSTYNRGLLEGLMETFDEQGQLVETAQYHNGILDGTVVRFDPANPSEIARTLRYSAGTLISSEPPVQDPVAVPQIQQ